MKKLKRAKDILLNDDDRSDHDMELQLLEDANITSRKPTDAYVSNISQRIIPTMQSMDPIQSI